MVDMDRILVLVHVPAGIAAVIAGLVAMLTRKGRLWHRRAGDVYLLAILVLFSSGAGLVLTRGPQFLHLFILGAMAALFALTGYFARKVARSVHIGGMGGAYVLMLTAFYVDNGPRLPFWELLPTAAFWLGPALIGAPLIVRAILRHGRLRELR